MSDRPAPPDRPAAGRPIWLVRAGREAKYVGDFEERGVAGLGWSLVSEDIDLPKLPKDELARRVHAAYPDGSEASALSGAGQLVRWRDEVAVGDGVATYDRDRRRYLLGEITSELRHDEDALPHLPRVRSVDWTGHVPRDVLSEWVQRPLNAMLTLSKTRDAVAAQLRARAVPLDRPLDEADGPAPSEAPDDTVPDEGDPAAEAGGDEPEFGEAFTTRADEAIEDRIVRLSPEQMEHFVAGLLRGMGYRTTVSPTGADRGVDVFASPDGLGLEEPRVFVEVKHRRTEAMGAQALRSFLGGRTAGDRCLYVSTGGFTKDARYEADRAAVPLRLLGLTDLRKLVVDLYPKLDEVTRGLLPLRRVYVPLA